MALGKQSDDDENGIENAIESTQEEPQTFQWKKELLSWAKVILGAVLFSLFVTQVLIVNAVVPTGSMMDTIPEESRLVAYRLAYFFSQPERFDIIVFEYPDDETQLFVKRIVGMPGETVELRGGKIYIDGSETPLEDDFVRDGILGGNVDSTFVVPEDSYFMLGDNRMNSLDSPDWNNPYVHKDKILGEAVFTYWPSFKLLI